MKGGDTSGGSVAATGRGTPGLQASLILILFAYQSLQVSDSFGRYIASPVWLLPHVVVPGLSALAGHLAMLRLARDGVPGFLRWLAVRLGTALLIAVALTALIIGPLVSTRPAAAYFSDPELWTYFLNLLFWPQFTLPGVFVLNNVPLIVNDIFWALPAVALAILGLCATAIRPERAAFILVGLLVIAGAVALAFDFGRVNAPGLVKPFGVIIGFLLGALSPFWRRLRPGNLVAAGLCAGLIVAVAVFNQRSWGGSAVFNALIAAPASYLAISLAALPLPRPGFAERFVGGLLLLGFPVQQASIALGSNGQGFLANLAISLPITAILAALSWYLVESRLLALAGIASAAGTDDDSPGARVSRPISMARARRLLIENLPMIAIWLLFILLALAVMAMVIFASQPDSAGI